MGLWKKNRERSVRIRSDNTSSSLRARSLLPPRLPPFIGHEGSRSAFNSLPTKSNRFDPRMYLLRPYLLLGAHVREEPVPTPWCSNSSCGRFSSRHPPPPNRASTGMRQNELGCVMCTYVHIHMCKRKVHKGTR